MTCLFAISAMADGVRQAAPSDQKTPPSTPQKHQVKQLEQDIQTQDPNADRIGFFSTAEVLPKGTMSFNDYDIGLLQISWGVAKDLELSFTTTVPIFQGSLIISAKYQLVSTDRIRFAMQAYTGFFKTFIIGSSDDLLIAGGGASGILDVCVGHSCNSLISFGARFAGGVLRWDDPLMNTLLGYQVDANGIFRVSKRVKLFLGLSFNHLFASDGSGRNFSGMGVFDLHYGVRIYGSRFAGDIGLIRPVFTLDKSTVYSVESVMRFMPMGYPFLSFTYKW